MLWVLIKQIHLCEFLFHYEAFAFQLSGCRCCGFKTFSIQTYLFFYLSISLSVCLSVLVYLTQTLSLSLSFTYMLGLVIIHRVRFFSTKTDTQPPSPSEQHVQEAERACFSACFPNSRPSLSLSFRNRK